MIKMKISNYYKRKKIANKRHNRMGHNNSTMEQRMILMMIQSLLISNFLINQPNMWK